MKSEKRIGLNVGLSLLLIIFGSNKTHAADSSKRKLELSLPVMPSNGITSVSLSPNQQFLVTNHVDGGATAWRVTDRAHIRRLIPASGSSRASIILDDGSVLMNDDQTHIVLKDLASGDTKQTFSDGEPLLRFSYVKSVGLVTVEPRGVVRIWDLQSAKFSEPIPLGCDEVGPIAVSSDGEYLAALCNADSLSDDLFSQYVRLWTIATRSMETWKLAGNYSGSLSAYMGGQNNALSFREELRFVGHYLMLSSNTGFLFRVQGQLKLPANVQDKVFGTPDHFQTLVTPSGEKIVCAEVSYLWDAYSKVSISLRPPSEPNRVSPKVFSSDFSHIFVVNSVENSVDVYDLAANAWERSFETSVFAIRGIAVSANGERVATTSIASLRLWDMSVGNEMTRLLDGNAYMKLGTSSTEQYLTVYLLTKPDRFPEIRRMSLRNGTTERSYRPKGFFEQLVLSPDGSCFVTKSANRYTVYSSETGDESGPSLDEGPTAPTGLIVSNHCDSIFIPALRDPVVHPFTNTGILWDRKTNLQVSIDYETDLSSWAFSPDVKFLASTGPGGRISLWSTGDGSRQMITVPFSYIVFVGMDHPIVFSPRGEFFLAEFSHQILRIGTDPLRFEGWCITQPTNVTALAITPDGQTIISGGDDGTVRFWSESGQELVTAVGLDDRAQWDAQFGSPFASSPSSSAPASGRTRWLSFDRQNHFDTSNFDDTRDVHWIASSEQLELLPLEALMQTNFQPNLLALRYHRKPVQEIIEPSDLHFARPIVKISMPRYDRNDKTSVSVTVDITKPRTELKNKLSVGTSVRDLRLFRDHQLIREMFFEADKDSTGVIPKGSPTCKELQQSETVISVQCQGIRIPHSVPLMGNSNDLSSDVQFSAYAFNKYEIKSDTFFISFRPDQMRGKRVKPSAYVIAVGVNANDNCYISLKTAASDARRTASFLSSELSKTGQFSKVVRLELTSDYSGSGDCYKNEYSKGTRTTVNDATAPKIKAVFETLGGERPFGLSPNCRTGFLIPCKNKLQRANPGDVIIFSFSGHGDQDASGLFHLFPADTQRVGYECLTNPGCFMPHMFGHSISSDNLRDWVRDIDAASITFILDTCHSGEAIESDNFKPAPMGSRALGELAFSKGMRVLVASSAAGLAADSGLLTESLLDDGIRLGGASAEDGTVRLSDLLTYATRDVPDLYISKKIGDSPQKPELFDFDLNEVDPVVALRKSDSLRITSFNDVKLGMAQAPVLWALQNCCTLKRGESELQWTVYDKRGLGLGAVAFTKQVVSLLSYGRWHEYQTSAELALAVSTDLKGECKSSITTDEDALNGRQARLISENVTESVYLGCPAHLEEVVIFKDKFIVTRRTDTLE